MRYPFSKLVLSQANVRRIKAGVAIEELAEDIARRTLLQNLTVRPIVDGNGAETGMYEVPAGGRRYRALELLVKKKRLARTAAIPCIVRTDGLPEEDSLAENVQRAPLHPLDQVRAFVALREKGQSEEDIAAAFFVSVNVVRQRLRLAAVSEKLLEVYAEDGMTLEQLMSEPPSPCSPLRASPSPSGPRRTDTIPRRRIKRPWPGALLLQGASLAWFIASKGRRPEALMAHAVTRMLDLNPPPIALPAAYKAALSAWTQHVEHARRQATAWRFAAAASIALCTGLAGSLSLTVARPALALHIVENGNSARVSADRALSLTEVTTPTNSPSVLQQVHFAEAGSSGPGLAPGEQVPPCTASNDRCIFDAVGWLRPAQREGRRADEP